MSDQPPAPADPADDNQRTLFPEEDDGAWLEDRSSGVGERAPFSFGERERYDLRGLLAVGGMGIVERVFDRRLGRIVVRKRAREVVGDIEQRLAREAWVVAQLKHPFIIEVLDAGQLATGHGYYTMPLVEGRPLSECLMQARGPDERRLYIRTLRDTCEAVGFAHQEGFVHRDLKPDNIMVGSFGETHVMDWGLARPVPGPRGDRWRADFPGEQVDLTGVGAVLGTPSYMSPEQAQGGTATAAGDVWSLGAILYEIVMGRRLFDGASARTILSSVVLGASPKLEASQPDMPGPLHAILARALSQEPSERFPDAKALADELTRWLEGRAVRSYQYTRSERVGSFMTRWKAAVYAVGGALALGSIGMAVFALEARDESAAAVVARNQAQAAMQAAILAREAANRHLQQSLQAQIRTALADDDRFSGEVLASSSLRLGPDPVSIGALMRWSGQPVPEVLERITDDVVKGRTRLSADGHWMVRAEEDTVELWQTEPLKRRWSRPAGPQVFFDIAESGMVVLRHMSETLLIDPNGAATSMELGYEGQVLLHPKTGEVYEHRPHFRKLGPMVGPSTARNLLTDCGHAVTFTKEGWWSACSEGLVHQSSRGLERFPPIGALGVDVPNVLLEVDEALYLGTIHSQVARVDRDTLEVAWVRHFSLQDVVGIRHLHDGNYLLVFFQNRSVLFLDAETGDTLLSLPRSLGTQDIGLDEVGRLSLLQTDGLVRTKMDPSLRNRTMTMPSGVTDLSFSPDGRQLVVSAGQTFQLYDWPERVLLDSRLFSGVLKSVDHSASGSLIVAPSRPDPGQQSSLLRYVGQGEWQDYGHPAPTNTKRMAMLGEAAIVVNWSKVGPYFHAGAADDPHWRIQDQSAAPMAVTSNSDASVAVWSLPSGLQVMRAGSGATHPIPDIPAALDLAIDDAGTVVLVEGIEETLLVDLDSGVVRWRFPRESVYSSSAAIDPTGSFCATGMRDGSVVIRALEGGAVVATLQAHAEKVDSLSFSRDGAVLLTGGWDNALRIWDTAPLRTPREQLIADIASRWNLPQ